MKKLKTFCLVAITTLLMFSCTQDSMDTNGNIEDLSDETLIGNQSKSEKSSTVVIYEDPDGPPETFVEVTGATSKLNRNANGITVNFKTDGLIPGNAYTLWFVVFGDTPGPPSSTYAAGHVIGGSGKGNFSGHLSVGDIFDTPSPNGSLPVFNTPLTAEVHIALRTHGPVQPGMMPDQIETIDGGCLLPEIGFPSGPNLYPDCDLVGYCANIQVAMHPGN